MTGETGHGASQADHLVKMANQIALNMAAWGNEEEVARKTGEHMAKFWTPEMRALLIEYQQAGGDRLLPVAAHALRLAAAGD